MNKKGQLSIEIIILLAIFLLFFQAMIYPSIEFSENVIRDTQAIVVAKKNVEDLAVNIEQLASQDGYGRRPVYFYLPDNAIMDCNSVSNTIDYNVDISLQQPIPYSCNTEPGHCVFRRAVVIPEVLDCNVIGPSYKGIITIHKAANGNIAILTD
jgi:hypothetical protein